MPGSRFLRLGSVIGVPIFVTPSWVLVTIFITITYSDFLRTQISGLMPAVSYLLSFVYAITLALSVLVHELGHTFVSKALGLPVRRIVVFLLGGISEIEGEAKRPRDEFAIAAAGPAMSFVLAAAFWAAALPLPSGHAVTVLLELLAWSNLVIAIFNVLPGLPLDGGRLVQAGIWSIGHSRYRGVFVAAWSGRVVAVLLGLAVLVSNTALTRGRPIDVSTVGATVLAFGVAAFLWLGASQTLRTAGVINRAEQLQVARLVRPAVYVPASTPLSEGLRLLSQSGSRAIVVVDSLGRCRAIVREDAVIAVPPERRPWTTVGDVSRPLVAGLVLPADLTGPQLLERVQDEPGSEYLVLAADGSTQGVIATDDVAAALGLPTAATSRNKAPTTVEAKGRQ
jgi:Zn-dependent protease/CBS domain-containing protein